MRQSFINGVAQRTTAVLACLILLAALPAQASSSPTITLIIDDIGYNLKNGLRAINLPGAVSYAVLPHTPYSKRLAKTAYQQGKTVMLHAPMTNVHQKSPGPGSLTPQMNRETFRQELEKALADIPFVQGVNNHMGSELTQDKTRMQWLMEAIRERRLFFIDSRTTAKSVAAETAQEQGVPSMTRDVFLDHIRTPEAVSEAFDLLIAKAQRNGHAVGIGHPHSITLQVLENRLPQLQAQGIRLISVPEQLLAVGQVYQDVESAPLVAQLPHRASQNGQLEPMPSQGESYLNWSPTFWHSGLQRLNHYAARDITYPEIVTQEREIITQEPVVRKPMPERLVEPEHRTGSERGGVSRQAQPVPSLRTGPQEAARGETDLLRQPVRDPEWLKPIPAQPWDSPVNRKIPEVIRY